MFRFRKKTRTDYSLLLYSNIQDVIATHSVMGKAGMKVSLVPPPIEIAIGCDLAIQFHPAEEETLRSLMHCGEVLPGKIYMVDQKLPEINNLLIFSQPESGYIMAACHNIKVTVDLSTQEIVNISGGGCPDIPYVARELVGATLPACPEPIQIGSSLCTYMLQLAVDGLRQEVRKC